VHAAVRTSRYKLVSPHDNPHVVYDPPSERRIKEMLANLELYDLQEDPSEIHNVAARHPEIVDRLLEDYERWFDDVTSGRDFTRQAPTLLGTAAQPTVILSRFDNRGWRLATDGWDWGDMHTVNGGHWDVHTPEAAAFRVKLDFEPKASAGVAYLKFAGREWTQPFPAGVGTLVFERVELPAAAGPLRIYLKSGRYAESVAYAELARLR
jgi:arylsulfatase/arylsulfatase A